MKTWPKNRYLNRGVMTACDIPTLLCFETDSPSAADCVHLLCTYLNSEPSYGSMVLQRSKSVKPLKSKMVHNCAFGE